MQEQAGSLLPGLLLRILRGRSTSNKSVPPDEAELAGLRDEYAAALAECGRA